MPVHRPYSSLSTETPHHLTTSPPSYQLPPLVMPPTPNFWTLGCIYGASAVVLGAFGAHGLKSRQIEPARIKNWETAAHYQVPPSSPSVSRLLIPAAPTLRRAPCSLPQPTRRGPVYGGNDDVFGEYLRDDTCWA
jgi:hypothetical protein